MTHKFAVTRRGLEVAVYRGPILTAREVLGPIKFKDNKPGTIRYDYGNRNMRYNTVTHVSDSSGAKREPYYFREI